MSRERSGYLLDMLNSARQALGYVKGKTKRSFLGDEECQDAVVRRLEIIGEAARQMPKTARDDIPEIPWEDVIGLRNVVIHQYTGVDMDLIWETLKKDLPRLVEILERKL